jgi:hypothetical protein
MGCPFGPVTAETDYVMHYPVLSRPEVEALQDDPTVTGREMRLIATLLAAWDSNLAVARFAQEADWPDNKAQDSDYGMYVSGYRAGYAAARGELRALLGIKEA